MCAVDMQFTQKVELNGYHWKIIKHPKLDRMMPALHRGKQIELPGPDAPIADVLEVLDREWRDIDIECPVTREYSAADYPGLYRQFAAIELTSASLLEFANAFGFIGVGEDIIIEQGTNPDGSHWACQDVVEFSCDWVREINTMAYALNVLNALDKHVGPDLAALSEMFSYKDGSWHVWSEILSGHPSLGMNKWVDMAAWSEEDASPFEHIAPSDIVRAATEFLSRIVNKRLEGRVSSITIWDDNQKKARLVHRPTSLLGVMWLQLAEELTGTSKCRPCIECGTVFEMIRKDRMFCSEACQKRYGRKKAKQTQAT